MVKRLILFTLIMASSAMAQEGGAAVNSRNMGKNNEWQNWIFAASAMVAAAAGVLIVSMDQGSSVPEVHSH